MHDDSAGGDLGVCKWQLAAARFRRGRHDDASAATARWQRLHDRAAWRGMGLRRQWQLAAPRLDAATNDDTAAATAADRRRVHHAAARRGLDVRERRVAAAGIYRTEFVHDGAAGPELDLPSGQRQLAASAIGERQPDKRKRPPRMAAVFLYVRPQAHQLHGFS